MGLEIKIHNEKYIDEAITTHRMATLVVLTLIKNVKTRMRALWENTNFNIELRMISGDDADR